MGGTETYLGRIAARLAAAGHALAFGFEVDAPVERARVPLPDATLSFRLPADGLEQARAWKPDVIYAHGLLDPSVEEAMQRIAPAVFFAHAYYGTCISGEKTHKFPVVQPCTRRFGAACLALYHPRRCGGLNPLTMTRDYARQRRRQRLLADYAAVVTASSHMQQELARHGAAAGRVFSIPFTAGADDSAGQPEPRGADSAEGPWRLVFAGRMDRLKGGGHLLDALTLAAPRLAKPVRVVFAGDGPERGSWQRRAGEIARRAPALSFEFTGWLDKPELSRLLDHADLLVMPSLWPEPYGLVGPEANRHGVPVVAYATGGIPEWLTDGVNGALAPADPPTASGLADAMVRCFESLAVDDSLRQGAIARARAASDDAHAAALLDVLAKASGER